EVLLCPAERPHQGLWGILHHDLERPAFPIEEEAFDPTHRADAGVMVCRGTTKVELAAAIRTAETSAAGFAEGIPAVLWRVHWRKSLQGKFRSPSTTVGPSGPAPLARAAQQQVQDE